MPDNQKIFSQIADLGRNINILSENVKKNTSAIESVSSEKSDFGDKKLDDTLNSLDKTLKEIQKSLISKQQEQNKQTQSPAKSPNTAVSKESSTKNDKFDTNKIAGDITRSVVRAFQEGGVAPKPGNYLVGENGPEIVSIPKGSGVIPLDLKDLMAGISKVPELSEFLKEGSKAGVYGSWNSGVIVTEDGKKINLNKLETNYQNKYDNLEDENGDPKMLQDLADKMNSIVDIQEKTSKLANDSIRSVNSQRRDILDNILNGYSDEDFEYITSIRGDILKTIDDKDLNSYTVAKADLIATQMLLEKKTKESSMKDEFDKLGKIDDKSSDVVNPKLEKAKKDAKEAEETKKSDSLLSKIGLKKRSPLEKEPENKEDQEGSKEKKESAFLSKTGKFTENVVTGVASRVTGNVIPGLDGGALARKGIGALKKSAGDKKEETSRNNDISEMKESKSSLNKMESQGKDSEESTLKSDVKKLSAQPKPAETKKEPEPIKPKETPKLQSEPVKNPQISTTPKDKSKSISDSNKSESSLGTPKDIEDIKSVLTRIASILEGPLTVSPMEPPFRPDSRRF